MENKIHQAAAQGFELAPESYDRGRPGYPAEAMDYLKEKLSLGAGRSVLDIGAGTGKFTQLLIPTGASIMALEPVEGMRKKFSELYPAIPILQGTAESIPLPDGSAHAVTVATAFHWFDGPRALQEFHRVLLPDGKLGILWNARDESFEWMSIITEILEPYENGVPRYRSGDWKRAFEQTKLFTPLQHACFRHVQTGPPELLIDRVESISFISALPDKDKAHVLGKIRGLISSHPMLSGRSLIDIPYRTDVFWCSRQS